MPEQSNYPARHYRVICNVVLFGTYLVVASILILLLVSFNMEHAPQTVARIIVGGLAFAYVVIAHILLNLHCQRLVSYMLTAFYLLLGGGIVWCWGINTPIGTLTFALAIVLAGILLTARHALWAALLSAFCLVGIQAAVYAGWYDPALTWTNSESSFGDVFAYSTVFGMLALVSWLYNREMERSLSQARLAEGALQLQKATLKTQVKKRTEQLRQAQLKEIQQMYRFAELGQLGVTLLHDLANHLTALTLEIDDLQKAGHSKTIARAHRITHYLGKLVDSTRERLKGGTQEEHFDMIRRIDDIVEFLRDRAEKANVVIDWQPPVKSWGFTGDASSLSQVIAIIICNAIDAYGDTPMPDIRRVIVTFQPNGTTVTICISNQGKRVTKKEYQNLFKPFHSTKKSGMGVGLFIAKQTVELQFSGTLALNPKSDRTEFVITLPLTYEK